KAYSTYGFARVCFDGMQSVREIAFDRQVLPNGRVRLASPECTFLFEQLRPGALLVTVSGHDRGQFGGAALAEMRAAIVRRAPLELYCDLRRAFNADVSVSEQWAAW